MELTRRSPNSASDAQHAIFFCDQVVLPFLGKAEAQYQRNSKPSRFKAVLPESQRNLTCGQRPKTFGVQVLELLDKRLSDADKALPNGEPRESSFQIQGLHSREALEVATLKRGFEEG